MQERLSAMCEIAVSTCEVVEQVVLHFLQHAPALRTTNANRYTAKRRRREKEEGDGEKEGKEGKRGE